MSKSSFGLSTTCHSLLARFQAGLNVNAGLAKWSLFGLYFALVSSTSSTALAQRVVPSGYLKMQLYADQLNKQDAAQKNAIVGEAKVLANQSTRVIEQCEKGLVKLRTDLAFAGGTVQNCEKALEESESALRTARKQRADQEERILAAQDEVSPYRIALKSRQDAEESSVKNTERVLKRPVKDGNPQKLGSFLTKSELKMLEVDKGCVDAFRQYEKAKEKLAQEIKRVVLADKTIAKLDETIQKLSEIQKRQKAELSTARGSHKKLKNEASRYASSLEIANIDLQSAQLVISQITGR